METDATPIQSRVPGWIVTLALSDVGVAPEAVAALRKVGIKRVGDCEQDAVVRLACERLGDAIIQDAQAAILEAGEWLGAIAESPFKNGCPASEATLLGWMRRAVARLPEMHRNVLSRRLGLDCEPQNQVETGASTGLSRMLLRSTEAECKRQLAGVWLVVEETEHRVTEHLDNRRRGLGLRELCEQDRWFAGLHEMPSVLEYLFKELSERCFWFVKLGTTTFVSRVQQAKLDAALKAGRKTLRKAPVGTPKEALKELVCQHLPEECPELASEFFEECTRDAAFSVRDSQDEVFIAGRMNARAAVREILASAAEPLHALEIKELVLERYGLEISENRAGTIASEEGCLLALGMYGHSGRRQLGEALLRQIAKTAESIIRAGRVNRQWHVDEIISELAIAGIVEPGTDARLVNSALQEGSNLVYLGRRTWTSPSSRFSGEQDRRVIKEMVFELLLKSGRPMTRGEILRKLKGVCGVGRYFQVSESDRFISVGGGRWGLRGRDYGPIDRPDIGELRLANTLLLRDRFPQKWKDSAGPETAFAGLIGITPAYWSLIRRGHRPMSEKIARTIEKKFKVPQGSLDK